MTVVATASSVGLLALTSCTLHEKPETVNDCSDLGGVDIDANLVSEGLDGIAFTGRGIWLREKKVWVDTGAERTFHYLMFGSVVDEFCEHDEHATKLPGDSLISIALWDRRTEDNGQTAAMPEDGTYLSEAPGTMGWDLSGVTEIDDGQTLYESGGVGELTLDYQGDRILTEISGMDLLPRSGPGGTGRLSGVGVACPCDIVQTVDFPGKD